MSYKIIKQYVFIGHYESKRRMLLMVDGTNETFTANIFLFREPQ